MAQGKKDEIELRPDGWERFRQAVHAAAKSGPKHRTAPAPKAKERPASKGRVHKGKTRP
jgi:hypothetical protein